jgi:hypothetical protein
MKLTVLWRGAVLGITAGLALAPAALAASGDTAKGAGAVVYPGGFTREFDFEASTDAGGITSGRMTLREVQPDGGADTIEADVVCLAVSGKEAQVVGRITASPVPAGTGAAGTALVFDVADAATPGAGQDRFAVAYTGEAPAGTCGAPAADVTIDRGEIAVGLVVDPTPPPPPPPPPPPAQAGCVAGSGALDAKRGTAFALLVRTRGKAPQGLLTFTDRTARRTLVANAISSLVIDARTATIAGTGRTERGRTVPFEARLTDGGARGRGNAFAIAWAGYSAAGALRSGNVTLECGGTKDH